MTWTGPRQGGEVLFRRTSGWGAWRPPPYGDSPSADRHAVLIPAGGALGYELSMSPSTGAVRAVVINTTDGPPVRRAAPATEGLLAPGVRYLSRVGWGAEESLRFGPDGTELFPTAFYAVQTFTVHHTVTANDDPDPAATVRAIYFLPHRHPGLRGHWL